MAHNREEQKQAVEDAEDYLSTGGLGEVIGLTQMALDAGHDTVSVSTDMAMAMAILADEALKARGRKVH